LNKSENCNDRQFIPNNFDFFGFLHAVISLVGQRYKAEPLSGGSCRWLSSLDASGERTPIMKDDPIQREIRNQILRDHLEPLGWLPMGDALFFRGSKVYDLGAADITQLDRIEAEGLFIVAG
jgi:hypothetical protein